MKRKGKLAVSRGRGTMVCIPPAWIQLGSNELYYTQVKWSSASCTRDPAGVRKANNDNRKQCPRKVSGRDSDRGEMTFLACFLNDEADHTDRWNSSHEGGTRVSLTQSRMALAIANGTSLHFRGIPLLKIQATVSVISMLPCVSNRDLQIGKKSSIKSSILHYLGAWEILLGLSVWKK